ncbi:MAG: glycoside hydrolase 5 family protein [Armatimonadota bacterium]
MRIRRRPGRGLIICCFMLLASLPLLAESLEFRAAGFFASPDTRVKLHRESWRYAPHLDVDGVLSVSVDGPILRPGYINLNGGATKTEIDAARRRLVDSGMMGPSAIPCRKTFSAYAGGVLMRLEYGAMPPEIKEAICRVILPIAVFNGRRARWDDREMMLPAEKPARLVFLDDPAGKANRFRFDLGNGRELGVQFLSPVKSLTFADCRLWNEQNYHLQAAFAGNTLTAWLCLLAPEEPFPGVTLPAEATKPAVNVSEQEAVFSALGGRYRMVADDTGRLSVQQQGAPLFSVDPPYVREKGRPYQLAEPISLRAVEGGVEVISRAKNLPFRVRQLFTMQEDGWLSASAEFEGVDERAQAASLEVALPTALFAGKTVRAGERFVQLPVEQAPNMLVNDWNGKVLDYELLPGLTLICDQRAKSALNDYRKWGQPSYKINLLPRDGIVRYRLHFRQDDGPPAVTKGNLLRNGAGFEAGPDGVQPFANYSWTEKLVAPGVPPVFDTTTSAHGAASLRLTASDPVKLGSARGFAFVGAVFNRVALQRDRAYTVSAYLKADRPGMKAVLYCGETTWAGNEWGEIPVTTEWQRYSIPFYTGNFRRSGYYLTWVGLAPGCTEGTLWVDAVQLEEGGLSDFQPAAAEYGVEIEGEKLFEQGAACRATLRVRNNGRQPLAGRVHYVIRDYWEREARAGTLPVQVAAGSNAAYPVDLGRLPCGYYRGAFTVPGGEVKEIIFGVYQPQPLVQPPDDWPLACHNDPSPLVRKLGFGAVRAFEVFEFSGIAPKEGPFDFTRADRMVREAKANGLTIMPIFGEFRWPSYRPDCPIPAYALAKVTEHTVNGQRVRMAWPKLEAWKAYVRALTARYKDEITYWEVMNEPNLRMTPAEYLPYLKAAYEAAKEGNPECRIVGICATSDFAGKPGSFTDSVLKLGGAAYLDILSVHLYNPNPPERTLETGSDRLLEGWRTTLQGCGKDTRVWHSERSFTSRALGYSPRTVSTPVEYCDEPQFLIGTFRQKAEYLVRETLLDAVAGKGGRFFWFGLFHSTSFLTTRYHQPYGLDHTEYDGSPAPELIAANGLARALAGRSHPVRQLVREDGARGCVFTGEAGSVAALWNWQGSSRLTINVGNARFTLRDFFGEPIPLQSDAQGRIIVELNSAPKYLSFDDLDGAGCCRMLEGALTAPPPLPPPG